jgi:hypothetical protein
MSYPGPIHFQADLIWPDGTFKKHSLVVIFGWDISADQRLSLSQQEAGASGPFRC